MNMVTDKEITKLPRLFVGGDLAEGQPLPLSIAQAHYLRNVLRREAGALLRVFNGRDGEYLAALKRTHKRGGEAICERMLAPQPNAPAPLHLIFAPVKKARLDVLIEKAVELGATHLHPVITRNTENRTLNMDRLNAQIVEAAEQCERLDLPVLSKPRPLTDWLPMWDASIPVAAALERTPDALPLSTIPARAVLIGPEGGFTAEENALLQSTPFIRAASLGPRILRSETAALYALSLLSMNSGVV